MVVARPAVALVRFDFEQKYFVHPGVQTWDFSLYREGDTYHIFYTSVFETNPGASAADSLRHATSKDLKHWTLDGPVLAVGQNAWDQGALWAPDVFRDEAHKRWVMAYTGADMQMNQSICMAYSDDLFQWTKAVGNPVVQPDTSLYVWDKNGSWSNFRDPFIYRQDGRWNMLVTAKQSLGSNQGVLYHGTSDNLLTWRDVGPLFVNDGATPWLVLESPQYHVIGTTHHLLFGEFDTPGITILSASSPAGWTMADRVWLEATNAYAPEVDEFDPGVHLYSRLATFSLPAGAGVGYVVRLDTLHTDPDGTNPVVYKPHPMAEDWIVHDGYSNYANPTFGDNPVWRGEPSSGMIGNSYYASGEWHQGPLSGRGAPGVRIGDGATGVAETYRFPVTGNRMTLLVGGGDYPQTCYVALVDAADSTILYRETGTGSAPMTLREWDLTPYQGRLCFITIVDQETGPMGQINVDEILEIVDATAVDDQTPPWRSDWHRASPNPFNPRTTISFDLPRSAPCEVRVMDLRGYVVWRSGGIAGRTGVNFVTWDGQDSDGAPVGAGTYLYSIEIAGKTRASGKVALIK